MQFTVTAALNAATGQYVGSVEADGIVIETENGFKDTQAVDKWAKGVAEQYKKATLPTPIKSYSHSFSL